MIIIAKELNSQCIDDDTELAFNPEKLWVMQPIELLVAWIANPSVSVPLPAINDVGQRRGWGLCHNWTNAEQVAFYTNSVRSRVVDIRTYSPNPKIYCPCCELVA